MARCHYCGEEIEPGAKVFKCVLDKSQFCSKECLSKHARNSHEREG
jgi:ribosomal protein L24E